VYGIRGLANNWFQSYIGNRKQCVSIDSIKSGTLNLSCGVPHVSVLGPLLFQIYINDFQSSTNVLEFHLFADDSNIFYANQSLIALESIVSNQLLYVHEWLCANKLSLNKFCYFSPNSKENTYDIQLNLKDQSLKQEYKMRYFSEISKRLNAILE
jgi:hypothetical protein